MSNNSNSFNYTLSPQDFIANCVWSLPIHGRAALGGKISCVTTVATSLKNAVILIHGPIGCAFQRRINPCRGWNPIYDMPCTALTEAETVYGAYDKLLGAIEEVYEKYKPELILIISSDVSDQIGDYIEVVREESKVPCDIVVCPLVSCLQDGVFRGLNIITNALITQLLENVDENEVEKDEKTINVATLAQLSSDERDKHRELKSLIEDMGLRINGFYFANNTVDDIKKIPRAPATVAAYATDEWTKFLEKKYSMKYIETYPEPWYTSIEYGPYGFDGVDKLLLDIGRVYDIEGEAEEVIKKGRGEAEEALGRHASVLKGKSLSLVGSYYGGIGADLIRYCGMRCKLVILKFKTGFASFDMLLSEEAKKKTEEMWYDFCSKYDSEPEILVEPTLAQELKALKKIKPDLVVPSGFGTSSDWYEKQGFKTLVPNRLFSSFSRTGYWSVIDAAIEARRALERPCSSRPLLSMIEYDEEYGDLSKQWADNARVFRHVWYDTI